MRSLHHRRYTALPNFSVNTQTRKHANGVRPFGKGFLSLQITFEYLTNASPHSGSTNHIPLLGRGILGMFPANNITVASVLCMRKAAVED